MDMDYSGKAGLSNSLVNLNGDLHMRCHASDMYRFVRANI